MTRQQNEITRQRKVLQLSATFFIGLFFLVGCRKEETTVGQSLEGEGLDVHTVDTFSLITYSDELDSMESDETAVNMLGAYNDPVFGGVECGIVTQIRLSSANPSFAANISDVVVDSVVLALAYTGIKFYAGLDDIEVEVYEITDDIVRDDQDYYTFTNINTTGVNHVLAGTELISPDVVAEVPVGDDTLAPHLRINLDPATIGDILVQLNGSGDMATDEQFVSQFKGLYIKVDPSIYSGYQGTVLYFALESSLSDLTLYFHETTDPTPKEYVFNINSNAARFNKIDFDRTGTAVESVLNDQSQGQDVFYTQAGSIWAVVEFPHIMSLNQDSTGNEDRKIINSATLILPVQDYAADPFDPSTSLFIARVVDATTSDFTLDYSLSSTLSGNTVKYDQDEKEFRFDMTLELQGILNGEVENKGYRIYAPSFFASSIERTIFNGPNADLKKRARLEVTYTDY